MNPETFMAWKSLYLSVFMTSIICAAITTLVVAAQLCRGQYAPAHTTTIERIFLIPKIMLRLRVLYFTGFPTILMIIALYAYHLGIDVLTDV